MNKNKNIVGIPRAMSYFNFFPFWYGFFNALGIDVILSDKTTKKIVSSGSALVVTETCLPIKVYMGAILNLLEKGIEKIFVPSLQSFAPKIYNCSKIRGLPDMVRNVVKQKFTMIEATLDKSEKNQGLYEFLTEIASHFHISDFKKIKEASKQAWRTYNNFQIMTKSGMPHDEALKNAIAGKVQLTMNSNKKYPINVAVVSHAYNVFDEHISMKLLKKLENMEVRAFTSEQLTTQQLEEGINAFGQGKYWANEHEMTGCAGHYIQDNRIDGIITLTAFGCGPDSLMIERIMRGAKTYNKPLLHLTIDEHTGEAGFITRLEAFVDMLYRKKRANLLNRDIKEKISNVVENTSL